MRHQAHTTIGTGSKQRLSARQALQSRGTEGPGLMPASVPAWLAQVQNGLATPGTILQLQRAVGNRAVTRLLNRASDSKQHQLPKSVQRKLEHGLGADFSNVTIHEGPEAPAIGALAYTQGNALHFAPGQYHPHTQSGQQLIGHELAHVVQQRMGQVTPTVQAKGLGINTDPGLEREADELGERAATGTSLTSAPPSPPSEIVNAQPVVQGMFVMDPGIFKKTGRYILLENLEDLLDQVRESDESRVQEATRLFKVENKYYDWGAWFDNKEEKEIDTQLVDKVKENKKETKTDESDKEQEQPLTAPLTHLLNENPEFIPDEHKQLVRTLGGPKSGYQRVQLVMHALGEAGRLKTATPEKRLERLIGAVKEVALARKQLGDKAESTLTIFVAPEGYFSYLDLDSRPKETGRHQYTPQEYLKIVSELRNFSSSVPDVLIIPGSIMWYEAPQEEPTEMQKMKSPLPRKHTEFTYNTSPAAYQGKVFLYSKHVDTGGDIDKSRPNQKMKMDELTKGGTNIDPNQIGYFSVGGLHIGLEICGDHGSQVLNQGLKKLYKEKRPRVDYHILIAAGQSPNSDDYLSDGWVINADQASGLNFKAYAIKSGKIIKKNVLGSQYDERLSDKEDQLKVVEMLLDSVANQKN